MQGLRAFWNRGLIGKLVIIGGGATAIVVSCCMLLVVASLIIPTPKTTNQLAAATRVAVAPTESPTATSEPTDAPTVAPTDTPQPTNTPEPPTAVPTPTPGMSPEVQRYLQTVAQKTKQIGDALQKMGALLQRPRLSSDDWRIDLAAQLATIQIAHSDLTKLDPPPEMREIHTAVTDATQDCSDATKLVARGIDRSSASDFQDATTLLRSCTTKIQSASDLITAYRS